MALNVNNSTISSEGSELNGRAQSAITTEKDSDKTVKIETSYFKQLERGPAKPLQKLTENYNLDDSLKLAYEKAINFANKVLLDDDLAMSLETVNDGNNLAIVKNIENEQVVQEYNPIEVLQMYSSNYDLQGIVIDALI